MTKSELLRRHLIAPAIDLGPDKGIVRGRIGQTHADLIAASGSQGPNIDHGFITDDGEYRSREQTRDYLNSKGGTFDEGEPSSEQLRQHVPFYETPSQRFYSLGGAKAVSIVHDPEQRGLAAAIVQLHHPERGPGGGFSIDYSGPTPVNGLDEESAHRFIEEAAKQ